MASKIETKTEFIVMDAAQGSFGGRKVAVLEVEEGVIPKRIAERSIGVVRIVKQWDWLNVGKTENSAFYRTMRKAQGLAKRLTTLRNKKASK